MGGIGGLIGISGGSHSSQATSTATTTNSNNTTETGSHNTDASINQGTGAVNAAGNVTISSIDPGAFSLAKDAGQREADTANQALAAAAQFGNNAFMAQTRTGDTLAAALTASQLPSQSGNVKLYIGLVVVALAAVVYVAIKKGRT